jgi:hypothetical protein
MPKMTERKMNENFVKNYDQVRRPPSGAIPPHRRFPGTGMPQHNSTALASALASCGIAAAPFPHQ